MSAGAGPEAVAAAYIRQNPESFGGRNARDLKVVTVHPGLARGQHIVRLAQIHGGVPVVGGQAVVAVSRGSRVVAATGETLSQPAPQGPPVVTASESRSIAVEGVSKAEGAGLRAGNASLSIYDPQLIGDPRTIGARLVWRIVVSRDLSASSRQVRKDVFVDARTGGLINSIEMIAAAKERKVCDAESSPAEVPCLRSVRSEGGAPTGSTDVDRAYDYAGDTWQFFMNLGRDSLDGQGMRIISTVNFCPSLTDCPYDNAYWDGDQMVYGTGYPRADDVVAHELSHGVTQYSSNLFYYYQSGALNEGLSDVFGEFVDLTNGHGNDAAAVRWKVGEDLPGGAIRDMANPGAFGDPDRTGSSLYDADPKFADDGGVHANSGIVNKAASLLTDGGTFNGQTVTGIGITKSIRIWYQASQLLTSGADFRDLGGALSQACTSLIGTASIDSADCTQVGRAVAATQLLVSPPKAPTSQAAVCDSGTATDDWSDSFEAGPGNGWTRSAVGSSPVRWYWASERPDDALFAKDGSQNLWANDSDVKGDTSIAMNTSRLVPARAYLRFDHSHDFEVTDGLLADGGVIEYSTNNGVSWEDSASLIDGGDYNGTIYSGTDGDNPLKGRRAFVGNSKGYGSTRLDLSTLAGRMVRFRFRMGTDTGNAKAEYKGWHVDRVRLYTCAGAVDKVKPLALGFTASDPTPVNAVTPTRAASVSYRITFSEPVTGLEASDFTIGGTSTGWVASSVIGSGAGPYQLDLNGPSASDGTLNVGIKADSVTDAAGNIGPAIASSATKQLRIDRTAPTTSFSSGPSGWLRATSASFRFTGTDTGGSGVSFYECTIGAFIASPADPRDRDDACRNPMPFSGLVQGEYTALVRAVDAAGNVDATPASRSFTVDTIAPETAITGGPTAGAKPRFSFTSPDPDLGSLQCQFDREAWAACRSPLTRSKALSRGPHVFRARALDKAGNVDATPASKTFSVR